MSQDSMWRKCPHCGSDKYCSEGVMRDHIEDCPRRPSRVARMHLCPKCGSVLSKVSGEGWLCVNEQCDYQIGVIQGGKLP